jgi:hypothetical protein
MGRHPGRGSLLPIGWPLTETSPSGLGCTRKSRRRLSLSVVVSFIRLRVAWRVVMEVVSFSQAGRVRGPGSGAGEVAPGSGTTGRQRSGGGAAGFPSSGEGVRERCGVRHGRPSSLNGSAALSAGPLALLTADVRAGTAATQRLPRHGRRPWRWSVMRVSPSCVTYRIGLIPEPKLSRCSSLSVSHPTTSWTLADHQLISGCQARGRSIPGQPLRRTPRGAVAGAGRMQARWCPGGSMC